MDRLSRQRVGHFVDTMQPTSTSIRARRAHAQKPLDLAHASRYRRSEVDPLTDSLRGTTLKAATVTAQRVGSQRKPRMAPVEREQTNARIHDEARVTKAKAAALRAVELDAGHAMNALHRSSNLLKQTLEHPRRTLWLVDQCEHRRAQRPHRPTDEASRMLGEERALAAHWKASLEAQVERSDQLLLQFRRVRKQVAEDIALNKRSLTIHSEAFSKSVLQTPLPADEPVPQSVEHALKLCDESKHLCADNKRAMDNCKAQLQDMADRVAHSLKQAVLDSKEAEKELRIAAGTNRCTLNSAKRTAKQLEHTRERNAGPISGQWVTTAERPDRPVVQAHNRAPGRRPRSATAKEVASAWGDGFQTLSKSLQQTQQAAHTHARLKDHLEGAVHDRKYTTLVDEEVLRLRKKYEPGRRV